MLLHFNDLFVVDEQQKLTPKVIVKVNDLVLMPKANPSLESIEIDGIPIPDLKDELLEVDIEYDRIIIFVIRKVAK